VGAQTIHIRKSIPFSPPYISQDVVDEVTDTLLSGWITSGPKVNMLEAMMKEFTQLPACVCVNSWTSGAILTLKWWGIQPGDEVIVPAYTYAATALAVIHAGAHPVMVDVGEDFNMDPAMLRKAIGRKTKAIIPVDFAGWPCDYKRIREILEEPFVRSLFEASGAYQAALGRPLLLADAAHSLGATYRNRPAGLQADIAIYSLHAVKNITTAEGGVIGLNLPLPFANEDIYSWMKINSMNGQTRDAFAKTQGGGGWRYDIVSEGLKINMPDVCAAIGLAQLREYDKHLLPGRKRIVERYCRGLKPFQWAELPPVQTAERESSYHIFPLCIKGITNGMRDAIIEHIHAMGVSVNVHFIPLPTLTLFREKGYDIDKFPVSFDKFSKEITLPVYPQLTDDEVDYILFVISQAYDKVVSGS